MSDPAPAPPPRRRRRRALAILAALAPALLVVWSVSIEPRRLETTEHALGTEGARVRVLHVTDLHVSSLDAGQRRHVLDLAASLNPDLIAITGDTVTAPLDAGEAEAAAELLAGLAAPLGVFACLGNHESWSGPEADRAYAGIELLRGASRPLLEGRLVLHGVESAAAPLPAPGPAFDLLLCHYPAVFPRAAAAGHELVLAGHSHGGQVRLPFVGALWLPFGCDGYDQGWFEEGATRMYVSRGVGTSILPVRFWCRPEVALVELRLR